MTQTRASNIPGGIARAAATVDGARQSRMLTHYPGEDLITLWQEVDLLR